MLKKIVLSLLFCSSIGLAQEDYYSQGRVDLIGPVGVQIQSGTSSWAAKLPRPLNVNPLSVVFWNSGNRCPVIPITSVSVKYVNDSYWYSTSMKNGYYYIESNYTIEAIKLDFYLNQPAEVCVVKVSGFRDIPEPTPQPPMPPTN